MMPKPTLIFTGTKNFGKQLEYKLQGEFPNSRVKFISADNELSERRKWIEGFMAGDVDVLISTTILAWGVNLPARHVVIPQTTFGLQDMPICDIQQMIGRSGRPRYDDEGDAFILLDTEEYEIKRDAIEAGEDIYSLFSRGDVLQFHGMAEIAGGDVRDYLDFHVWHSRSFANLQGISPESAEAVIKDLVRYRCVDFENDIITPKVLGKISYWFYFPPRVVYQFDLNLRRFSDFFESRDSVRSERTGRAYKVKDIAFSMCFNWMIDLQSFVPRDKRGETEDFRGLIYHAIPDFSNDYDKLHGSYLDAMYMADRLSGRKSRAVPDFGRLSTAISTISNMSLRQNRDAIFDGLQLRYSYGAPEELVGLLKVKGCGKVMATALYDAGIKKVSDITDSNNYSVVLGALNSKKKADTLIKNAKAA